MTHKEDTYACSIAFCRRRGAALAAVLLCGRAGRLVRRPGWHAQTPVDAGSANIALYVQHGALRLSHCLVENVSPAGYCVIIDGSVTSLKAYHTIFRKSTALNAIEVSSVTPRDMLLANCSGNGPLSTYLGGYHDYTYDSTVQLIAHGS
jgi:hypothetical protein